MKTLLLSFVLWISATSFSQGMGDVTIYSNTGNKFYVVLNGVRQNMQPETNVKVTGLTNQWYECKIMSANNNFTIDKKIMVKYDTLITYRIIEKRGKYKMRYFSETALGKATAVPDQSVVQYHATETTENVNNTSSNNRGNGNVNTNVNAGSETVTTSTTTTTTSTTANNTNTNMQSGNGNQTVGVNVSISENDQGANINMNMTGTVPNENVSTSTSTTTTSTGTNGTMRSEESTTTTSSGDGTYYEETTTTTTTTTTTNGNMTTNTNVQEGNLYQDDDVTFTMENDCHTTDQEVDALVKQVKGESFADDQSRIANMAAKNKCMTADQVSRVAKAFTFEDNKLAFLKLAYDMCPDKENYYKTMETLTFSGDKEELEQYINSK